MLVDYYLQVVSSFPAHGSTSGEKGKKMVDVRYPQGMYDWIKANLNKRLNSEFLEG